jgi:serine/threonine protein kinase/tetratricopeptide (TPR) repeat protein
MTNHERLKEIFTLALSMRVPEQRNAYLAAACHGDPTLREQIESLLAATEQAGDFLERTVQVGPGDGPLERAGSVIGRYKLLEEIGQGGFGVVYMAEQLEPVHRKVALKIIKAGMDTREVIARFEAERQALALMDHPNIARVLDAGATETGRPYFVMELVRGIPITEYCDSKNLSSSERLRLFVKVCHAVQHAHQKGIIHRDLKPSNVLVAMHDDEAVPKVIDFGVAKAIGEKLTEKTLFTGFHDMIGTPAYMSPEQAELSGLDIDTRSDIYSLGVLLYELLTGAPPFDLDTIRRAALDEVRRMIREDEPPKPSTRIQSLGEMLPEVARRRHVEPAALVRLVRGDLDWIVMKTLEKDRRRRYDTPDALADDVARHLNDEPVIAAAPSTIYTLRKFVRRHRAGIAFSAAVAVLLLAGTAVSTWQAVRATRAERAQTSLRLEAEAREKISRAVLAAQTGDPERAEQILQSIPPLLARLEPNDAAAIESALGRWRGSRGEWSEAIASYRKVIEARPADFEGYNWLAPLLVQAGDAAGYEEVRRDMVARFGDTKDPLLAERLVKDCLILPWSGPEVTTLARLADMAIAEGPRHKAWRRFELARGLVDYRQGRFAAAKRWMHDVAESGEWSRDVNRDVQGYVVLAMAHYNDGEPSFARSTLITGLAVATDGLPKDAAGLREWPAWNDWIIARALMDEASRLIEGRPVSAAAAASAAGSTPPSGPPSAAGSPDAPGAASASIGAQRIARPSSSLTVLPVWCGGQLLDRLTLFVGGLFEQAGLEHVEVGETPFDPGGNTGMKALAAALGAFVAQTPLTTDYALYAEYNGLPGQGLNELRAVLADHTGKVVWAERLTPDDEPFHQIEGPDPRTISILLAERVGPLFGLDEETRRNAKPSRLAALMEQQSGLPPESELNAIAGRIASMKNARHALTLLVVPMRANGASDTASAIVLAREINDAGLCRAISTSRPADVAPNPSTRDEWRIFWNMATSFRAWVREAHPDADYVLFVDCEYNPERWEMGFVHLIACDRHGEWALADLENSEHPDFQAVKPTSTEACGRLAVQRLGSHLQ